MNRVQSLVASIIAQAGELAAMTETELRNYESEIKTIDDQLGEVIDAIDNDTQRKLGRPL